MSTGGGWQKLLNKLYETPGESSAFYSAEKLRRALERKYKLKIPIKKVQLWLENKYAYAIHRPRRVKFDRNPIIARYPDHTWQADILFLPDLSRFNNKFSCILVVIDVVTRFAWAQEMKSKSGVETAAAFKKILKRSHPRLPEKLHTDKGTEFYNKHFKELMKRKDIILYSTESENKAAIAERFVRTLKELIYRFLEHTGTRKYTNQLQNLLQTYNSTYHDTIKMPPEEVTEENVNLVLGTLYSHLWDNPTEKVAKFKIGDKVRLSKSDNTFRKAYKGNWTDEVFTVSSISGSTDEPMYPSK
jgi:transposase InsO family protein